ncbi:MAG: LCP family protein [Acidimicrobiales bacterium]
MLDHLDDPIPFTPSPELVAAATSRGRRLRRRHRLGVTGAMIPVVLVLALVAGAAYVDHRLDQVQRVDVAAGVLTPVASGAPLNVLVVGTDGPRLDGTDDGTRRSDTIMVVHVDRSAHELTVLSLPRDLVFDDATGAADRLNAVLPRGGPTALIATIHDHLGIDIAHYVEIDFQGFEKLIDAVGGITVQANAPVRDLTSGLSLDVGCQHLDGAQALSLSRSRHVEFDSGDPLPKRWVPDGSGDLGRIERQQVVLGLVVHRLHAMTTDLGTLDALVSVFADNTTVDATFDRGTILALATWGRALDPDALAFETLPTRTDTLLDGAEVLRPTPEAAAVVDAFGRSEVPNIGLPAGPPPQYAVSEC